MSNLDYVKDQHALQELKRLGRLLAVATNTGTSAQPIHVTVNDVFSVFIQPTEPPHPVSGIALWVKTGGDWLLTVSMEDAAGDRGWFKVVRARDV